MLLIGPALIVGGLIGCATCLGALIGLPMIFFGVMAIAAGPLRARNIRKTAQALLVGKCPYCGSEIKCAAPAFSCPICTERVIRSSGSGAHFFFTVAAHNAALRDNCT